jgi:chromosome segregation ATPase
MPESMSELAANSWLRVERTLEELGALLTLVETQQLVAEADLRVHVLQLYQRLDAARVDVSAAELDSEQRNAARLRLDALESRLGAQEERLLELALDVKSLRVETISRVERVQTQVDAMAQLPSLMGQLVTSMQIIQLSVEHLRGDLNSEFAQVRDELHGELAFLRIDLHGLRSEVGELRTEMNALKREVHSHGVRLDRLEADVAEIKTEMKLLRTEIEDLRLEMRAGFAAVQQQIMTLVSKLI